VIVPDFVDAMRKAEPRNGYLAFHAPRYRAVLDLLSGYVGPKSGVLDIGRSSLTDLIARAFSVRVDSLGFALDGPTATGRHFHFDLNAAQSAASWRRDLGPYDVVVMAEVIEHIHTAPSLVLGFVRSLVAGGGILVLQTPNAAALHKRMKLLLGRNPYEMIREDVTDPGHFREYTRGELRGLAAGAGFEVVTTIAGNYFDYRFSRHAHGAFHEDGLRRAINVAYALLPGRLRPGITMVLRALGG
jgi:SAM-dependent methyltransferase